jgi:hypothetical protein
MKLLDESYFKAKLFAIAILVHDKEERTNEGVAILRQIAADARGEQAEIIERALRGTGSWFIVQAALDAAKGE